MNTTKPFLAECHQMYRSAIEKPHPVLSSILIGTAIVLFWRGVWGLCDLYLFPKNEALSFLVSTVAGIGLLLIHDGWKRLKELE